MATKDSTFTISGVVTDPKGVLKIKFANDEARVKKLGHHTVGNTNIRMFDLGAPMLKLGCVMAIRNIPELSDAPTRAVIDEYLKKNGVDLATLPEPEVDNDEQDEHEGDGEQDEPTGTDDEPTGTDDEPTGTDDEPTGTDDEPTGTDDEPTGTDDEHEGDDVLRELDDFGAVDFGAVDFGDLPEAAQAAAREAEIA